MAQLSQDQLKAEVGRAAIRYVTPGTIIGVGTGSTVAYFIEALGEMPSPVAGAVSSSERSTAALRALGIPVLDANEVDHLDLYVDGADEIDPNGCMIKGGGGALTREKIVSSLAERFVCIADASKRVDVLGTFPLPVEVVPMAEASVVRRFAAGVLGTSGTAVLRRNDDGTPYVTDNGQHILDVRGLRIDDPLAMESAVNDWPGVVTVGIFARQRASLCLLGTPDGVATLTFG
ncbi:ribose-5-phosphate isomerase RpiA [Raineyella fluvialis]|uniref:Ribose-5-phosphate isomerase A n=1 Tax=Raineyella fluvialis TaxID=2662261 RepID=A0A5Q2FC10_9ACTN|nr:ribose-5-phosphate isomerase RpiA [Raineyella fluvialis]QGF23257.1 ribose-5-phosphate isomerase RpiA [Raineyella fluvialis]